MTDATLTLLWPFVWISVVICLYGLLLRRLADVAFQRRMTLARLGEEALSMGLHPEDEEAIRWFLDNAFSPWPAVWIALTLPIGAISIIFTKTKLPAVSEDMASRRVAIFESFLISAFCANPVFGVLAVAEFMALLFFAVLIFGQTRMVDMLMMLIRAELRALVRVSNFGLRKRLA